MLYVSVYEGEDPDCTAPIFGSTDPEVIRGVVEVLARRLGLDVLPARLRPIGRAARPSPPSSEESAT